MAMTGAERQKRYRHRLKAKAATAGRAVDAASRMKQQVVLLRAERDALRAELQETTADLLQRDVEIERLRKRVADLEQTNMRLRRDAFSARARYVTPAR